MPSVKVISLLRQALKSRMRFEPSAHKRIDSKPMLLRVIKSSSVGNKKAKRVIIDPASNDWLLKRQQPYARLGGMRQKEKSC